MDSMDREKPCRHSGWCFGTLAVEKASPLLTEIRHSWCYFSHAFLAVHSFVFTSLLLVHQDCWPEELQRASQIPTLRRHGGPWTWPIHGGLKQLPF